MTRLLLVSILISVFITSCTKEELHATHWTEVTVKSGMRISILGDSYSTFRGYLYPESNLTYYPNEKTGVMEVNQTWWKLFIKEQGLKLECNNSYSGATIAKRTDRQGTAYVERYLELGTPELIFVFGATNDSWQKIPIGTYQYENWQEEDLTYFRPAFAYLLHQLQLTYPKAMIVNLINTDLQKSYKESMEAICNYYEICNISLGEFEKKDGHPSDKGMESICQQLTAVLVTNK